MRLASLLLMLPWLSGCSGIQIINALTPGWGQTGVSGLAYGAHPRQRLDLYRPADATAAPVVVFFYGGRWQSGERGDYAFVARALAARGHVVVVPDYSLYPEVRFPAFVEDGAAAVAWVQRHVAAHGGDPGRIVLMGHSAGAQIAALLALDPAYTRQAGAAAPLIRGLVGLAGPYDFLPLTADDLRRIFPGEAERSAAQAVRRISPAAPPMLLLHGAQDTHVAPKNLHSLANRARELGVAVETTIYPGLDHRMIVAALSLPLRFRAPVLDRVSDFIDRLAAGPAAGGLARDGALAGAADPG